ncbi:hypothetical protein [Bacillus sp. 445_BSPC]|uniref:hypothetical protein n=1 Tax=Bacillus sp. 445_BSPC TaxID=1581712 RepID=UPI000662C249|nr:hypothetical protein [Bacillus sp. 445_BSPC]
MDKRIFLYILLVMVIAFGGYQFKQHHDIKDAYTKLDKKYNALSSNSKVNVQDDAIKFLEAFYTYEGRPKKENINGLTTKEVQDNLFQTYEELDKEFEMPKDLEYRSDIDNTTVYHARDEYDTKAKVLATFDSVITINGKKSKSKSIAEINLELKNKKWIVTNFKILNDVSEFQGN